MKISKDIVNGGIYQLVQKMHTLEEENKELIAKCNQLEKIVEKQNDTMCEMACRNDDLSMDYTKLEKKLEIATKALEEYADIKNWAEYPEDETSCLDVWQGGTDNGYIPAETTLKQIQEVK